MRGYFKQILLVVIIAIVFAPWFFTVTPNLGYDLSYDFEPIYGGFPLPWSWMPLVGQGFGMYSLGTSWTYPVQIFFQLLLRLGVPFWFQMKYFALLPIIIISSIGLVKVSKLCKIDWFVPILVYLTNTYFLLLIDGGQLNLGLAYSIIPLSFYLFKKAISGNFASKMQFSLTVWVIGAFDMRIVFILALLIGIHYLFEVDKFKSYFSVLIITALSLALLNSYWILPSIVSKSITLPKGYGSVTELSKLNFTTITHSLFLQQPHWYKNVFGKITEPIWYFTFIPLLAFFSLLDGKKNKNIIYFAVIAAAGVFLAKGVNEPLGFIYSWIFENIPGFNLFRDSSKFFFITAFSYSILFGYTVNFAVRFISRKILYVSITIYLLTISYPVYTGKMTGTFSKPSYFNEISLISKDLSNDSDFGRILWLPTKPGLGYYSHNHPAIDGFSLLERRPFAIGTVGTYEQFNFLREAPFMGELFAVSGIKYISYQYPDVRRETLKQDNIEYYYEFLDQLTNLPWTEKRISDPPVPLLQTKKTNDHISFADNSYFIIGSDRIYWDLFKLPNFDLSSNALIFAEETPGLINSIDPKSRIISNGKDETDILIAFADRKNFYFPANELGRDPTDMQRMWKRDGTDLIWWRDFLQTKYGIDNLDFDFGGGWAVAEGNLNYELGIKNYEKNSTLFARVMNSSRGGRVEFWQGEDMIGQINTLREDFVKVDVKLTGYGDIPDKISTYNKADLNWYDVGNIESDLPIMIRTYGDINVINSLALISQADKDVNLKKLDIMSSEGRLVYWEKLSVAEQEKLFSVKTSSELTYKRINPTKYEVEVTRLDEPGYLLFSESFDSLWELNGQPSKPVYSLINGFYINEPGKYVIDFTPQKYVYPGLAVSGTILLLILGYLIYSKHRKKI